MSIVGALIAAELPDAQHWARLIEADVAAHADQADQREAELLAAARRGVAPLAYTLGHQRFMGIDVITEPGVIVPRPVTERVGRAAAKLLAAMPDQGDGLRVIDMCSGSGNLACALAHADPRVQVWSCDLMETASALARRNVERLGLQGRVAVRTGDLFGSVAGDSLEGRVDLVVCAPPFISTTRLASDRAGLLEHEPREAFDAGPYGLTFHQRTSREAVAFLRAGGAIVFEAGEGQARQVELVLKRSGYHGMETVDDGQQPLVVVQAHRPQGTCQDQAERDPE